MNLPQALRYLGRAARSLLPGGGRRPWHSHAHPTYSDAELLARAEEFNRNAEKQWRSIAAETAGRAHALNKPFSTVRDTPGIIYRLGLALDELDLGVGHTVLDFGAGACWLSSVLNRLRCRTVSIDVSPTALQLGQEMFQLDKRHRMELEPRFLPYDGHTIPLEDASVDRVMSFDAFHHVPNQEEVLREMFRVLKDGGRAVLAEPGEGHAHEEGSVYESEQCGVLENDLHVDDLIEKARRAGFDDFAFKPYPDASILSFSYDEYRAFAEGDDSVFPIQLVRSNLRHFHVISLRKGRARRDSRNPAELRAVIARADAHELRGKAGDTLAFRVRVRNAGDTHWLAGLDPLGGCVALAGHLLGQQRELVARGWLRAPLPHDVAPGASVELEAKLHLPERAGRYLLQLDMVAEHITYFEQWGSKTIDVPVVVDSYPDSRHPHRFEARIELLSGAPAAPVTPGSPLRLRLRLHNAGDTTWLAGKPYGEHGIVSLGGHLLSEDRAVLGRDRFRTPLPRDLAPLESIDLDVEVPAPPEAGRFLVQLEPVAEAVCWFEHHGSRPLELPVATSDAHADSRWPGVLSAKLELLDARERIVAAPGTTVSVPVRVSNTGNTLWLHADESRHGHVSLGGHLYSEDGRLIDLDAYRVRLPRAVPPGATLELACALRVPEEPGRYIVELDMVDEGIAWFASRGGAPARLLLVAEA